MSDNRGGAMRQKQAATGQSGALEFRFTRERVEEQLTLGDLIGLEERRLRSIRELLVKFAVDEHGRYLEPDQARARIDQLSLRQFREVIGTLESKIQHAVVPPSNGTDSGSP